MAFGVLGVASRCDVTGEAEGVGLAAPSPQPAGERQRLSGVAGGLVDAPGREADRPRAQKNERRPGVNLATAELLDGARNQRERLVSPAGEGVGGAEGRGEERYPDAELPRAAELETTLQYPGRVREIPATEVGAAESEQPSVQREGMIGRFSGPHGGLGVPDGLGEPAELGERVGEVGPRDRRRDDGYPEALEAQVALERDVPLQQGGRGAELAPGDARHAQIQRCDHLDRAIAEGARDGEGLLAEPDGLVVVASGQALVHHEGGDAPDPVLVAERPGEHLRLVQVLPYARPIAERRIAFRRSMRRSMVSSVVSRVSGRRRRAPSACSRWAMASRLAARAMARSPAWRR